jgi:isoamylase
LGATWDGSGVNSALFSEHADGAELCLFDGANENRDEADHNLSWNCGAEGPAIVRAIRALGERQQWSFLATLLLSKGVPHALGGDEIGRTQQGNNNAYCQDNEASRVDWHGDPARRDLLAFARSVIALRRQHPVPRRRQFFFGRKIRSAEVKDLSWFRPHGKEMTEESWHDTLLFLLNAHHEPMPFTLPAHRRGARGDCSWTRPLPPDTDGTGR